MREVPPPSIEIHCILPCTFGQPPIPAAPYTFLTVFNEFALCRTFFPCENYTILSLDHVLALFLIFQRNQAAI